MSNIIRFPSSRLNLMLLSYKKHVTASTYKNNHEPFCAVDENSKSSWISESGHAGEWFLIDLGTVKTVHKVQFGSTTDVRCNLYGSTNGEDYSLLFENVDCDGPNGGEVAFESGKRLRFIKLEFASDVPGCFSLAAFRVFGYGNANAPSKVENPFAFITSDTQATVCWNKVSTAVGYNVRFGFDPDCLCNCKSVYNTDNLSFDFLSGAMCYYAVDAFNENGVTKGDINVINTVAVNNKIRRVQ